MRTADAVVVTMKFDALPHVRAERLGFVKFFSVAVFGVPTFFALLVSLKRARILSNRIWLPANESTP